jgi:hypothetical protein
MRESSDPAGPAQRRAPPRLSRRRVVQGGVAAALVLAGSAVAFVRTRGYELPAGLALEAFSPWQFVVVQHAARRIVAPDRPGDPSIPDADALGVAGFVDVWVAHMDAGVRRDLGRFLGYLEHLAPLAAGHVTRFTGLPAPAQDEVLASLESSSTDLLRAGFDGLRSLVFMGYYRDARAWTIAGYDGPLVNRPAGGWK